MSNALAFASITYILRDLLNNALVDHDVFPIIGSDILVTSQPPDKIVSTGNANGDESPQLNIFLYRITPNAALRNTDLPTRDAAGNVVQHPVLAVNLHYLLTAFGETDLQREILLGYAMELFHEMAIFPRKMIRQALESASIDGSFLPKGFKHLEASRLADQIEHVKITPEAISMDDMSKAWTALQANYRTSVGYEVSVALIERDLPTRRALPVLMRGPADRGPLTSPDIIPPIPTLTGLSFPSQQPAARMKEKVVLTGHHLGGATKIRFTEPETQQKLDLNPEPGAMATRLSVVLPEDPHPLASAHPPGSPEHPESWRIGPYLVSVLTLTPDGRESETNSLPMVLAPHVQPAAPTMTQVGGTTTFDVIVRPPVREKQQAELFFGSRSLPVLTITGPPSNTLQFQGEGFAVGMKSYLRLRIDGVESLLIDRSVSPPQFDPSQLVEVV